MLTTKRRGKSADSCGRRPFLQGCRSKHLLAPGSWMLHLQELPNVPGVIYLSVYTINKSQLTFELLVSSQKNSIVLYF